MSIRTVIRLSRPYSGRYWAAGRSSVDLALVDELEHDGRGERLGDRGERERRPGRHRHVRGDVGAARGAGPRPAVVPERWRPRCPGCRSCARNSSSARWRRLLGTPARGSLGVGAGVGAGRGAARRVGVGRRRPLGRERGRGRRVAVARSTASRRRRVVARRRRRCPGSRLGDANTPVTARQRGHRRRRDADAPAWSRTPRPRRRGAVGTAGRARAGRASRRARGRRSRCGLRSA